jgi:hypothetical protein
MIYNNFKPSSVLTVASKCLLESAIDDLLKCGVPAEDILAQLVQRMDQIDMGQAPEPEKQKARDELLPFIEKQMMFDDPDFGADNSGIFSDGWTPKGFQRESFNEQADRPGSDWVLWQSLKDIFGRKKKATEPTRHHAVPRKPQMPKAELDAHSHLSKATTHLNAAYAHHLMSDHGKRDAALKHAQRHINHATRQLLSGDGNVSPAKLKSGWAAVTKGIHKLNGAMRESRLTPELDALTESLAKSGSSPGSRSKQCPVEAHISSALAHAKLARQAQGNAREHHLRITDVHVSRALEHEGFQPYYEGHPLRGKLAALHSTLRGL